MFAEVLPSPELLDRVLACSRPSVRDLDITLNKAPSRIGFHPEDILLDEPTRNAPLKWVVIVDQGLPPGRAMNAAVCVAAATSAAVTGLLGPDAWTEITPPMPACRGQVAPF